MSLTQFANSHNLAFGKALNALASGQCVAIPTETVYGLAADATNGEAVARIFELKGRPKFNPLICHVSSLDQAKEYGQFSPLAEKLSDAFWPGPLTLVVPLAEGSLIHPLVTAGLGAIGLRHPKGPAAKLIAEYGRALAAPSANRSGRVSPTTALDVANEFPESELVILDNGRCDVGIESTIASVTEDTITILRPGAVTTEMIEQITGIAPQLSKGDKIQAPGMMKSHYAPNAKVMLEATASDVGTEDAWLQYGTNEHDHANAFNLSESGDLREAAANLYTALKTLDASGTAIIRVSSIPETGLGIAINDRLRRAAAPRET